MVHAYKDCTPSDHASLYQGHLSQNDGQQNKQTNKWSLQRYLLQVTWILHIHVGGGWWSVSDGESHNPHVFSKRRRVFKKKDSKSRVSRESISASRTFFVLNSLDFWLCKTFAEKTSPLWHQQNVPTSLPPPIICPVLPKWKKTPILCDIASHTKLNWVKQSCC